jgi:hypothetical protein
LSGSINYFFLNVPEFVDMLGSCFAFKLTVVLLALNKRLPLTTRLSFWSIYEAFGERKQEVSFAVVPGLGRSW